MRSKKEKILIVDDNDANIQVLVGLLKRHYLVTAVNSGEEAVRRFEEEARKRVEEQSLPDLVLLDIMMPGMNGYELCRKLKSEKQTAEIPVLFISALGDISDKMLAFKVGGADFITKPFRTEEVLARVRTHLEIKRNRDSVQTFARMLRAILNSVSDVIITVDENLKVVNANREPADLCSLFTRNDGELFFQKGPDGGIGVCSDMLLQTIRTGQPVRELRTQCDCLGNGGKMIVLNTSPLSFSEEKPTGAVISIRDITRMAELEKKVMERRSFRNIVGQTKAMQTIYALLERISDVDVDVLITGENGTGKELIADALHHGGCRGEGPLYKVNCAALSESLLLSELFGHVRGAFTGAARDRKGIVETAAGGTVFLDEVGDMSPEIQSKLLRFIENREFQRLGESTVRKADVRIVAATNRNLPQRIESGLFREDLYYRLKGILIHLPPLRERIEDIPLLCDHFLNGFKESFRRNYEGLSDEVTDTFLAWPWPGNVRELKNALKHACILCTGGLIRPDHLPEEFREQPVTGKVRENENFVYSPKFDRELIVSALDRNNWNKARAANELGIGRKTLYRYIKRMNISN